MLQKIRFQKVIKAPYLSKVFQGGIFLSSMKETFIVLSLIEEVGLEVIKTLVDTIAVDIVPYSQRIQFAEYVLKN